MSRDRGMTLRGQSRWDDAEPMLRKAIQLDEQYFSKSGSILESMGHTGRTLYEHSKEMEAEATLRRELALRREKAGIENAQTLSTMYNLVTCLSRQGKLREAEQIHKEMHVLNEKVLGRTHEDALHQRTDYAIILSRLDKNEEAVRLEQETLALKNQVLGPQHADTLRSVTSLINFLEALERFEDCLPLHERAYKAYLATRGPDHPMTRERCMYYECMQETVENEKSKAEAKVKKRVEVEGSKKTSGETTSVASETAGTVVNTRRFGVRTWRAAKDSLRDLVSRKRYV